MTDFERDKDPQWNMEALRRRHLDALTRHRELTDELTQLRMERIPHRGFLERIPIAYCVLDRYGSILYVNHAGNRLLGFNRSSAVCLDFGTLLSKRQRGIFQMHLTGCFESQASVDLELSLHREILPPAVVHFRGVPNVDEHGQVISCSAAFVDITPRKRNEADLRFLARASKHLTSSLDRRRITEIATRTALPRLGEASILCLMGSDSIAARPAIAHVDRKAEERAARSGLLTFDHDDQARLTKLTPKVVSSVGDSADPTLPASFPALFRSVDCSGYLAVPLWRGDSLVGVLYILTCEASRSFAAHDLALAESYGERVAAALENARLFQEAQEAIRLRQDVLAIVSHDLRTPLHNMLLNVEMLLASIPQMERRTIGRRQIEVIRRAVLRMDRMIADLLDLSSIEAGHLSVHRGMHSLRSMLTDAVEPYSAIVTAKNLHVTLELPPPELEVPCDRERMIQVLTNLIGNAVKFTPADGRIRLWCIQGLDTAQISVFNSGPGIPASRLLRVFDRYWQAEETAQGGRGLGLFIAKGIVEAHGGQIRVQSDVGQGTTFTVTFPTVGQAAEPMAVSSMEDWPESRAASRSVLIVEDEPEQREAMAAALTNAGHHVDVASDGNAALEHVETQRPASVVLLDLNLPGVRGETVMRELHRNPKWSRVPVVIVSSETDIAATSASLGAAAYLRKPVRTESLVSTVERFSGVSRS